MSIDPKKYLVQIASIIGITMIACVAILQGHNGVIIAGASAAVAGIGGFAVGKTSKN